MTTDGSKTKESVVSKGTGKSGKESDGYASILAAGSSVSLLCDSKAADTSVRHTCLSV